MTSQNHNQGGAPDAVADYDRAIALNPNDAEAYRWRGLHKMEDDEDYDGALADFDRAIALNPDDVVNYCFRAIARTETGDYDAAIADCDRALAINPRDVGTYYYRGKAKYGLGDFEGAAADYDRVIAPDAVAWYHEPGAVKGDGSRASGSSPAADTYDVLVWQDELSDGSICYAAWCTAYDGVPGQGDTEKEALAGVAVIITDVLDDPEYAAETYVDPETAAARLDEMVREHAAEGAPGWIRQVTATATPPVSAPALALASV